METNFNDEMNKLCAMQIALWNDMQNDLAVMDNPTDEEMIAIFHKHLRETHHDAVLQLVKVKTAIDKIGGVVNG